MPGVDNLANQKQQEAQRNANADAINKSENSANSKIVDATLKTSYTSSKREIIHDYSATDYSNDVISTNLGWDSTADTQAFDFEGVSYKDENGKNKKAYGFSAASSSIDESQIPIGAEDVFNATDSTANELTFELPNYGVEDYINDRTKWTKGIRSIGDEPGYFYFKVFFKFNTNYGLFGGVLDDASGKKLMTTNSALRYLNNIKAGMGYNQLYKQENIAFRINSLLKFTTALSNINTQYPWLIKGISGLGSAMNSYTDKFEEEKFIELKFGLEATDMKIMNMLNLYKYTCYDDINCKEIIPSNLRKFDMMVVVYHVPIKHFQTAIMVSPKKDLSTGVMGALGGGFAKAENIINKTFNFLTSKSTYYKYKRMSGDDYSNLMSFQMFTFQNCEFDISSFINYYDSATLQTDQPFQFEETSIKIKYDRVYYHVMNEWTEMLYGSDGFWFDKNFPDNSGLDSGLVDSIKGSSAKPYDNFRNRITSIKQAKESPFFYDKNASQYKSLIEYSESLINDGLMSMKMKDYYSFIEGNIYGKYGLTTSDYYKNKLNALKTGSVKGNIYGSDFGPNGEDGGYFNKKLKSFKRGELSGNIYGKILGVTGTGPNRKNSDYLQKKIEWLKNGSLNMDGSYKVTIDEYGNITKSGDLVDLFNAAKPNELKYNQENRQNMINEQLEKYPNGIYYDPIKHQQKQIWNYALTGSSKSSSIGGALDTINNTRAFFGI